MTDHSKRHWVQLVALTTLAAATLVACGKKEEPAPVAAPAPAKAEPLKVAFAYVGPVGDGGWSFAHDNARKALEAEFGDKIQTSFVESVPEGADAERVFRDMASQGNKVVFGTSFGYMEPMLKVAASVSLGGSNQLLTQTTRVLTLGLTDCAPSVKLLMLRITSGIGTEATTPRVLLLVMPPAMTPAM